MKKIDLKICMGTMCYVLGGGELKSFIDGLPAEIRDRLNVTFSPCLDHCGVAGEPPYIELNGRTIARVSRETLTQILKEELKNAVR